MPFRLEFATTGLVPDETYLANHRHNENSGVPLIRPVPEPNGTPLAVVGGGPSARHHLDELRAWPGHVWAVNQSAAWLAREGIADRVWMFTVDPDPVLAEAEWIDGVTRAILGTTVDPSLVAALLARGAEVQLFNPQLAPQGETVMAVGGSSVCRTFMPALCMGYPTVDYFGCEGSLAGEFTADGQFRPQTHWGRNESRPRQMIVRCGDRTHVTTPDLYLTTQTLAKALRAYSGGLRDRSGGLLAGMIAHPDSWEVVALSPALAKACLSGDVAQALSEANRYRDGACSRHEHGGDSHAA